MVDYHVSSQYKIWKFENREELEACRVYTNFMARKFLFEKGNNADSTTSNAPVSCFACSQAERQKALQHNPDDGPWQSATGNHTYINAAQEKILVDFYLGKLPALVGPTAQVRRMRRAPKVVATAAMLYQRFFVSNSVLLFDPKVLLVAAVFLATKTEDVMASTKDLELASESMQAPVKTADIVAAEVHLIAGVHFDLHCFHPYKTLDALTEDVRTHLKKAAMGETSSSRSGSSPDWKTIYDTARKLLDDAIVQKDVALLYTPSSIGLASLVKAAADTEQNQTEDNATASIPWKGYLEARFPQKDTDQVLESVIPTIVKDFAQVYNNDVGAVKAVHKQLKKVKIWGGGGDGSKKKKKKKSTEPDGESDRAKKRPKLEAS